MTRPLVANGTVIDVGTSETIDTFVRPNGIVAGPAQRQAGGIQWYDAKETHPVQFDAFELAASNLVAPSTIRDSWGHTYPAIAANYPIDPDTGQKYSPWMVSHRLMWADLGVSDDFDLVMSWEVEPVLAGVMQVSLGFGFDLDAPNFENGCLYAYDISLGGVSYWHNVPMTPDVATCFDFTYYTNLGGSAIMPGFGAGRHWWRIRLAGGTMRAQFDGVWRHAAIARPAFTVGRTTVGVHIIGMAIPPDPNLVGPAAVWLPVVTDPLAVATVSSWRKADHP